VPGDIGGDHLGIDSPLHLERDAGEQADVYPLVSEKRPGLEECDDQRRHKYPVVVGYARGRLIDNVIDDRRIEAVDA
jgi:hypothetical protein